MKHLRAVWVLQYELMLSDCLKLVTSLEISNHIFYSRVEIYFDYWLTLYEFFKSVHINDHLQDWSQVTKLDLSFI